MLVSTSSLFSVILLCSVYQSFVLGGLSVFSLRMNAAIKQPSGLQLDLG